MRGKGCAEREPVYRGKPLSVWLQRYIQGGSYIGFWPEPEADEAIRQIGTNAIPTLLLMLREHDSKLKLALLRLSVQARLHKQVGPLCGFLPLAGGNRLSRLGYHCQQRSPTTDSNLPGQD